MMPPPDTSGWSSQSSPDGSKRWFNPSARSAPNEGRSSRTVRTTEFQRSVWPIKHGAPLVRTARQIATASVPVVASGFSTRNGLRAAATASAIGRWSVGGTTAITASTAGSATSSRQSPWKRAPSSAAWVAPRSVSRRESARSAKPGTSRATWLA
jgi:hypothetical protein